jgi:DNA-binding NarL/FixJ family response regulator
LQKSFLLGERECDVCQAFLNCATLEGVADALGISTNTVRSYMKVIYEKTGHRSQAELMKLLMGMTLDFEHIC